MRTLKVRLFSGRLFFLSVQIMITDSRGDSFRCAVPISFSRRSTKSRRRCLDSGGPANHIGQRERPCQAEFPPPLRATSRTHFSTRPGETGFDY